MNASKVIYEALLIVWSNKYRLLQALTYPIILNIILVLSKAIIKPDNIFSELVFSLFDCIIYSLIAITTHRIVLIGEKSLPTWGVKKITIREIIFIALIIMLTFLSELASFIPTHIKLTPLISFLWLLVYLVTLTRICLVFPATAVDKWISFAESWRLTRKYQFKLMIIIIILPIFLFLLFVALFKMLFLFSTPLSKLFPLFMLLTVTLMLVIAIASLSVAYSKIISLEFGSK